MTDEEEQAIRADERERCAQAFEARLARIDVRYGGYVPKRGEANMHGVEIACAGRDVPEWLRNGGKEGE